jgi:hypothetical protein
LGIGEEKNNTKPNPKRSLGLATSPQMEHLGSQNKKEREKRAENYALLESNSISFSPP